MHITFVALGQEQLSISLLSAVLKREGHTTSLAFHPGLFNDRLFLDIPPLARLFDRTNELVDEIVAHEPDLVAFTVLTPTFQWSLGVAHAVKQRMDVPIIFGGVHPSAVPEICLEYPCVDYVCVGEGEEAIVALCDDLPPAHRRPTDPIPNLRWREDDRVVAGPAAGFIQDLDSLPFWDKDLWTDHIRIADTWMTMTSRGCPYRCTFCFNNFFAKIPGRGGGKYLRHRSVENVIAELADAKQRYGIRRVDFQDDIFTTDRKWLKAFIAEYDREISLPFQCLIHPRYIDDETARLLKDAGCQHVQMGVQSADEEYKLKQLLRMEKDSHLNGALGALQKADLDVKLDHILGLPGEPVTAQQKALELYREFPPRRIQTFWLTHLAGIELTRTAVEDGELSADEFDRINRGLGGRFHTRSSAHSAHASVYRRYQLLFRLFPLLPRRIQERIRVSHVPPLPGPLANLLGVILEGANVIRTRDTESTNYARYYLHNLRRQAPEVVRHRIRGRGHRVVRALPVPDPRPLAPPPRDAAPEVDVAPINVRLRSRTIA